MSSTIYLSHPEPNVEEENLEANVEFYWIIPNWHQLQSDINSVLEHVQEFHLVSSKGLITSKWLLGFISIAAKETCVHPFIKLLATDGDCVCKGSVSLARLDKGEIFCQQLINREVFVPDACIRFARIGINTGLVLNTRDQIDGLVYRVKLQLLYKDFYQNKRLLVHFQNSTTSSLISDLKKLRNKSDFNNLIIRCHNDETVAANRDILECRNAVMEKHCSAISKDTNKNVIEFPDVSASVMEILVSLWYTGQLDDSWKSPELIENVALAADKFQIVELLEYLDGALGDEKLVTSSVSLLELAVRLGLKKAAQQLTHNISCKAASSRTAKEMLYHLGRASNQDTSSVKKTLPSSPMNDADMSPLTLVKYLK